MQKKNGDSFFVLRNNKFLQTGLNPIQKKNSKLHKSYGYERGGQKIGRKKSAERGILVFKSLIMKDSGN